MSALGIWVVIWGMPHAVPATIHPTTRIDWQFIRQPHVILIIGMRGLATINYGMLTVLIPLLLNQTAKNIYLVASYAASMLIVASFIQFLAGRAADKWGARLAHNHQFWRHGRVWVYLVWGNAFCSSCYLSVASSAMPPWALSSLMYLWVADFVTNDHHPYCWAGFMPSGASAW
jgi:hypothetical protein